MDLDQARQFIRHHHRGVFVTRRRDGSPQLSPVTCSVDDAGMVVVSSRQTAMKVKNIRREPTAALCAFTDAFFGDWVQVEGTVSIVSLPEAMDGLIAYYRSVSGEHPDWEDYRAAMDRDQRVLLRMQITRAGPDSHG